MRRADALEVVTDLQRIAAQIGVAARSDGLAVVTSDIVVEVAALKVQVEAQDSTPRNCMQAVKQAVILGRHLASRVEEARARRN
ncbi:hypothetical protein [Mycolicibacter sinensis]|uniref:hypothetical protein n=1 Tax=Mycolicibacter sinensis (strain JDM601) TaxID=875328 RepID=UPI001041E62A|nr:hypothetical protein [Mycolicibacter sinensis]